MIAAIIAILVINKFKRRQFFVPGEFIMATSLILIGVFTIVSIDDGVLIMILVHVFVYQILNGVIVWVYISEVCVDAALGFVMLVLWGLVLFLSLTTNYLMDSAL